MKRRLRTRRERLNVALPKFKAPFRHIAAGGRCVASEKMYNVYIVNWHKVWRGTGTIRGLMITEQSEGYERGFNGVEAEVPTALGALVDFGRGLYH